ncbi:MAG: hypothetical protein KIT79_15575 [Deltaproteobacteria bacterium]|nr:hypothetical protein [Deltaproteobacteria bacterium]
MTKIIVRAALQHNIQRRPDSLNTHYYCALLFSAVIAATFQYPLFSDPYQIEGDSLVMAYLAQGVNPDIFPDDLAANTLIAYAPRGAVYLYGILFPFVHPLTLSKLLPLLLIPLAGVLLFHYTFRACRDVKTAWLAVAILLLLCRWHYFYTGSWRVFALPLTLLYITALQRRAWAAAGAVIFLTIFSYALLAPVMLLTGLSVAISDFITAPGRDTGKAVRGGLAIAGSFLLAFAIGYVWAPERQVYSTPSYDEIFQRPEFGPGGHGHPVQVLIDHTPSYVFSWDFIAQLLFYSRRPITPETAPYLTLALVLAVLCGLHARSRHRTGRYGAARWTRAAGLLSVAGLLLALVAGGRLGAMAGTAMLAALWLILLRLSAPPPVTDRIALILLLSALFMTAFVFLTHPIVGIRFYYAPHQFRYFFPVSLSLMFAHTIRHSVSAGLIPFPKTLPAAAIGVIALTAAAGPLWDHTRCEDVSLYETAAQLPNDTMIVTHPYAADCVMGYGLRSVYISYTSASPISAVTWPIMKERTFEALAFLYSRDAAGAASFCRRHPDFHAAVLDRYYTEDYLSQPLPYIRPFDQFFQELESGPYWLENLPEPFRLKSWDGGYLTSCGKVLQAAGTPELP